MAMPLNLITLITADFAAWINAPAIIQAADKLASTIGQVECSAAISCTVSCSNNGLNS
jgi:hypothetical protein|nr:MAG TPA: Type A lantibiotic family [Caudoviricetes sp.]